MSIDKTKEISKVIIDGTNVPIHQDISKAEFYNLVTSTAQDSLQIEENIAVCVSWSNNINAYNLFWVDSSTYDCGEVVTLDRLFQYRWMGQYVFFGGQDAEFVGEPWQMTGLYRPYYTGSTVLLEKYTFGENTIIEGFDYDGVTVRNTVTEEMSHYIYDSVSDTFVSPLEVYVVGGAEINGSYYRNNLLAQDGQSYECLNVMASPSATALDVFNLMSSNYGLSPDPNYSKVYVVDAGFWEMYNYNFGTNFDSLTKTEIQDNEVLSEYGIGSNDKTLVFIYEVQEQVEWEPREVESDDPNYVFQYNYIYSSNTGGDGGVEPGLKYVNVNDPSDVTVITQYGYGYYMKSLANGFYLISSAVTYADRYKVQYRNTGLILFDSVNKTSSVLINNQAKFMLGSPSFTYPLTTGNLILIPYSYDAANDYAYNPKTGVYHFDTTTHTITNMLPNEAIEYIDSYGITITNPEKIIMFTCPEMDNEYMYEIEYDQQEALGVKITTLATVNTDHHRNYYTSGCWYDFVSYAENGDFNNSNICYVFDASGNITKTTSGNYVGSFNGDLGRTIDVYPASTAIGFLQYLNLAGIIDISQNYRIMNQMTGEDYGYTSDYDNNYTLAQFMSDHFDLYDHHMNEIFFEREYEPEPPEPGGDAGNIWGDEPQNYFQGEGFEGVLLAVNGVPDDYEFVDGTHVLLLSHYSTMGSWSMKDFIDQMNASINFLDNLDDMVEIYNLNSGAFLNSMTIGELIDRGMLDMPDLIDGQGIDYNVGFNFIWA